MLAYIGMDVRNSQFLSNRSYNLEHSFCDATRTVFNSSSECSLSISYNLCEVLGRVKHSLEHKDHLERIFRTYIR